MDTEFSPDAIDLTYEHTGGVPRLINKLCGFCLVYAATEVKKTISNEGIREGIFVSCQDVMEGASE